MPSFHLLITGRVQGVYYRVAAKDKAIELGLRGWVRNKADGNVEAVVSGDDAPVRQFIQWCGQGPPLAKVHKVEVTAVDDEDHPAFEIVR